MRHTPWIKPASSLPSDRLRPPNAPNPSTHSKGKAKAKDAPAAPKSAEVKRLEKLISAVQSASGSEIDPKGGCFCQARLHALSPHTPLCLTCALPLCVLNSPHHACPSCRTPLITPSTRTTLLARLDAQLAETLQKEAEEAERQAEEARRAVGAFPTLSASSSNPSMSSGTGTPGPTTAPVPQGPHKVMSLTASGKSSKRMKVTMRATYTPSPPTSAPPSGTGTPATAPKDAEPERVRAPPPETPFIPLPGGKGKAAGGGVDAGARPFINLARPVTYVPPPRLDDVDDADPGEGTSKGGGGGRNRKKKKGKENGGANAASSANEGPS